AGRRPRAGAVRSRPPQRRRSWPDDRLAAQRRGVRRQQHRRLRRAGGRHDGGARRRDPFARRIPDRAFAGRARRAFGAGAAPSRHGGPAMTFRLRAAHPGDLESLYEMAKLTGGGFTNLPADRKALARKLERAEAAYGRNEDTLADEQFVLVLEHTQSGALRGTCQMMTQVGQQWPFYSYRLATLTQHSEELQRTVRCEMLNLVTDLEGSSEVGGLFLHPNERAGGLGLLLARSRYLFIAMHRARFAD